MPGKMATVDFEKCLAQKCKECPAAKVCPRKLLRQEAPHEPPMTDPSVCRGCGDCARACPAGAIKIINT